MRAIFNPQPYDCLLNWSFGPRSKKTSKLNVIGLREGNLPVTSDFHAQRASHAENAFIGGRHRDITPDSTADCRLFDISH